MVDIVIVVFVFLLGFQVKNILNVDLKPHERSTLNYLWAYHFLFGILYWFYVSYVSAGDALMYYRVGSEMGFVDAVAKFMDYGPGSKGMIAISSVPAQFLSFFTSSIVFALLGYIGLAYMYVLFIRRINFNTRIFKIKVFPIIFFLPNLHFWSASLGKDTISFLCIALFIYAMQKPSKHFLKIFIALGLSYMVRPHITIFLIASFGISFMLDGSLKMYQKMFLMGLSLVAFIVLFEKFMSFVNLESLDAEAIQEFSDQKVENLSRAKTGSSVDISGYPYPLKVLTFLYRPFFFDINNALAIVASFENLILVLLSFKFISTNPFKVWKKSDYMYKGMFVFFAIGTLSFSLILGNLGIMLREKNMFIPSFFFICLWAFSYKQEQLLAKSKKQIA